MLSDFFKIHWPIPNVIWAGTWGKGGYYLPAFLLGPAFKPFNILARRTVDDVGVLLNVEGFAPSLKRFDRFPLDQR